MKRSVSVAIRVVQSDGAERVLAVLRPVNPDDPLGGLWGLPAATAAGDESEPTAAARVLQDKLGIDSAGIAFERINTGRRTDEKSTQSMTVYAVEWIGDHPPAVTLPAPPADMQGLTFYEDCRWVDPSELEAAARHGSLCTALYLEWLRALRADG